MKIIVTGAGGFIGGHTIKELYKGGYKILALDIRDSILFPEIKITKCDINDPNIGQYIDGGDKILHLCAIPTLNKEPQKISRVNVEGMVNLVQAALKKKAERIVFSSTGDIYFGMDIHPPLNEETPIKPNNYYALSKVIGEQILEMYKDDLPYIILRYGYIYGRGDKGAVSNFINLLSQDKRPTIYWGRQLIEQAYVKDIVQANIKALFTKNINQIFNIGTGTAISIQKIYDICTILLGKTHIKPILKPLRPQDPIKFWYDITKAIELLDYSPKWTLSEGIKDMLKEIKRCDVIDRNVI